MLAVVVIVIVATDTMTEAEAALLPLSFRVVAEDPVAAVGDAIVGHSHEAKTTWLKETMVVKTSKGKMMVIKMIVTLKPAVVKSLKSLSSTMKSKKYHHKTKNKVFKN